MIKPRTLAEWDKPNRVNFYFTMFSPQEERGRDEARRWGAQWSFWVCPEATIGDLWAQKADLSCPCLVSVWWNKTLLENPRDDGAWWAAVYGVAQSRTWLKRLSSSSSSAQTRMERPPSNQMSRICLPSVVVTLGPSWTSDQLPVSRGWERGTLNKKITGPGP